MTKENKSSERETYIYIPPDIEVVEIKIEQNILANASTLDMPGEEW